MEDQTIIKIMIILDRYIKAAQTVGDKQTASLLEKIKDDISSGRLY